VGVGELGGQVGVVVALAGVQVAAEAAGDLVEGPVAELMAADGGRGLQVLQQLPVASDGPAGRVWWPVWAGSRVGGLPIQRSSSAGGGVGAGSAWRRHAPTPSELSAGRLAGDDHGPHPLSLTASLAARRGGTGETSARSEVDGWRGWVRPTWRPEARVRRVWRGSSPSSPHRSAASSSPWSTSRWSRAPVATRL
jgi:hypothetical protein